MPRLFDTIVRQSTKNGEVRYVRTWPYWSLAAKGMDQSSDYLVGMWKNAVRRVPVRDVRSVLILGLGIGACLPAVRRRFPRATVTVIEWDPVMVELAEETHAFKRGDHRHIIIGDVRDELPRVQESFDLILCDLFDGSRVSDAFKESSVIAQLRAHLSTNGWLIFNAFREPELYVGFDAVLSHQVDWKYRWNRLALYRQFGRGCVGDPLPRGYAPARTSFEYLSREARPGGLYSRVGDARAPGMRWHHGPLWFEGYRGDNEPQIESIGRLRLVTWQPVTRLTPPPGWHRSWLPADPLLTGFVEITHPDVYWQNWSSQAKRHRARWIKTRPYEIKRVSLDEFVKNYGDRRRASWLVRLTISLMRTKVKCHGDRVHFFAAFDAHGEMLAGLAVVDVPELSQSIHLASFIRAEARPSGVGVGLIDEWFRHCIGLGYRFVEFDLFWAFGDPWSWRGFSRFKSQFGTRFVRYPHAFVRLAS